jgi:hypothetical protein
VVASAVSVGVAVSNQGTKGSSPAGPDRDHVVPWAQIPGPAPHTKDGALPPLDGKPITLSLITRGKAVQGERYKFVVRITNTSGTPVALEPCPYYRVQYLPYVETGYLNCAGAPAAIPANGHVDFGMEIAVPTIGKYLGGTYKLLWELGGEGTEGRSAQASLELERRCCRNDPPRPAPLTLSIVHQFMGNLKYRGYTGPNPSRISKSNALGRVHGDYVYSLGLRDVGSVHSDGRVDWHQVWIIASDSYVTDVNRMSFGPPLSGGSSASPPTPRPGWSRSITFIDAKTGKAVIGSYVF